MTKKDNNKIRKLMPLTIVTITILLGLLSGCTENKSGEKPKLIQTGSSTVLPLAIAWAEEFNAAEIAVSGGGSSYGLNQLLLGNADLGDASRILKGSDYEKVGCNKSLVNSDGTVNAACNGIFPVKWIVAYDMLAVVVNPQNTWAPNLNYTQLYQIFTDDNPAIYWDEVKGLENAPHEEIEIYAPDEASGTYDYFFEEIIPNWGKDNQQAKTRLEMENTIYHPSADDNVILNAIKENTYAIGFFGFAYYVENQDAVKPVSLARRDTNYQQPSFDNVANYPMARTLHIYTNGIPEPGNVINEYLQYILSEEGQDIVPEIGYVRLNLVNENIITEQLIKLQ